MALFSKKPKAEKKVATAVVSTEHTPAIGMDLAYVLSRPRITEKATDNAGRGVYVFDVPVRANKRAIALAVTRLYKVVPRMVRVAAVPSKVRRSARTGKVGVKKGGKKAYVYLKSGDTITLS